MPQAAEAAVNLLPLTKEEERLIEKLNYVPDRLLQRYLIGKNITPPATYIREKF